MFLVVGTNISSLTDHNYSLHIPHRTTHLATLVYLKINSRFENSTFVPELQTTISFNTFSGTMKYNINCTDMDLYIVINLNTQHKNQHSYSQHYAVQVLQSDNSCFANA